MCLFICVSMIWNQWQDMKIATLETADIQIIQADEGASMQRLNLLEVTGSIYLIMYGFKSQLQAIQLGVTSEPLVSSDLSVS